MTTPDCPANLDPIAQTNIELLAQMERRGYSLADRVQVQRAYELAFAVTACQYRSSGRSLLEHLLGATSIIVSINGAADLVAAALVHAVYVHGDFGRPRRRIGDAQRAHVRARIGDVAERIVQRYSTMYLTDRSVPVFRAEAAGLHQLEREALCIRLADQLDLYGTREALYYSNVEKRLTFAREVGPSIVTLAHELGQPLLAAALERAYADALAHAPDSALIDPRWRDGVIVPGSYRTRPTVKLYRAVRTRIWKVLGR